MFDRKLILRTVMLLCVLGLNLFAQSGTGDISFTNGRTVMEIVVGIVLMAATVFCIFKLVMAFLDFRSDNFGHGMYNLMLALFAGIIVGYGVSWMNTLTGQNITATNPF